MADHELISEETRDGVTSRVFKVDGTKALLMRTWFQGRLSRSYVYCPSCRESLGITDHFCRRCGIRLRENGG